MSQSREDKRGTRNTRSTARPAAATKTVISKREVYSPPREEEWMRGQNNVAKLRYCRGGRSQVILQTASCGTHFEAFIASDHPVRSFQRWLRDIFLMSRPPLLGKEGNTPRS